MHDVLIAGGGCAGLSLAVRLDRVLPRGQRIVIVEPRTAYVRDRHWCAWNVEPHPFEGAVSHRWPAWTVHTASATHRGQARGLVYQCIPADRFYELALEELRASPRVSLELGANVESLQVEHGRVHAATSRGELRAHLAFDARPDPSQFAKPPANPDDVRLLQHFVGHVIECDHDAFDPQSATLMDFRVRQDLGIHFMYVLPFSRRRALVESTFFTLHAHANEVYEEAIAAYLAERGVHAYARLETERGAIPMTTEPLAPPRSKHIVPIGLRGGMVKPSTGYAFLSIQRWCERMAERLREGHLPEPPPPRPRRETMLDRVFLSHLARNEGGAPGLFHRLFARNPPEVIVRFLSDRASTADILRVMSSLPLVSMTAATARSAPLWLRSS